MCNSIVDYYGVQDQHSCGYCKTPNTNFSHGMWAYSLTVQDYQGLIDRGWRRSGCYCYKPSNDKTCCPLYTIKCEALNFKISKSQKKILKRMAKFLRSELKDDDITYRSTEDLADNADVNIAEVPNYSTYFEKAQQKASKMKVSSVKHSLDDRLKSERMETENNCAAKSPSKESGSDASAAVQTAPTANASSARPMCGKAKFLRKQRKQNKLLAQGKSQKEVEDMFNENKRQNHTKTLEELFEEINKASGKLEIKLVSVVSNEMLQTLNASADLYKKYQMTVHGDPPEGCEKSAFVNFLVKSPLQQWKPDDGPPEGYGSFHEQYWLDEELIAVAVIDILPSCLSSVYFFYDPAYSHLSLGTYSSLREVYLTRQMNKIAKNLQYYYMGFYIHSCPKMRYKARMSPSRLLCPETYQWFDIQHCLAKLDKEKYSRFNDDIDAIDEDGIVDLYQVLVLHDKMAMPYRLYEIQNQEQITKEEEEDVKEYAALVGRKCAKRMLLYRK